MVSDFEAVIGLEVHVQLATQTKIFCGCPARMPETKSVSEVEMNSFVCPICVGHPGTLPVLNRKVVEYAIKAGLATHCEINQKNIFARKNYFYPDLPKGYQLSQYDQPICRNGWLEIEPTDGVRKRINITRIHMEEDAGKSLHMQGFSLLNLNRAGVPLIEVVSEPEMRTPGEAGAYLRALHAIVTFLGISDGNMEEGNFRCDANVSVRKPGDPLGTRVEIKNVNSFKFIEKSIQYEIARQIEVIRGGGKIVQETRSYDSARGITLAMRSKEEAEDYRYFPDPDLIPVYVDSDWIGELSASMPELPEERRKRYEKEFELSSYDAGILTSSRPLADFFDQVIQNLKTSSPPLDIRSGAKSAANWIAGEVLRLMNEGGVAFSEMKLTPSHLSDLICLLLDQKLSSTGAKQVLAKVWLTGETVATLVEREGLTQVSDEGTLVPVIDKIIAAFPSQVAEYRSGKEKLIGFFVGKVMKETGGKANPAFVGELVRQRILLKKE
jgi:aspartyl-tRNA(Asn)/glutamyl-tRNA(Gln) amidotransferase subunit B